jgi:hypothetical protein
MFDFSLFPRIPQSNLISSNFELFKLEAFPKTVFAQHIKTRFRQNFPRRLKTLKTFSEENCEVAWGSTYESKRQTFLVLSYVNPRAIYAQKQTPRRKTAANIKTLSFGEKPKALKEFLSVINNLSSRSYCCHRMK